MKKITKVECFVEKIPLNRTFVTAVRSTNIVDTVLVKLTLEDGSVGYGSAPATTAITGDTIQGIIFIINELFTPVIIGSYLHEYESVIKKAFSRVMFNTGAKMAIDLAYHDLLAKQSNQPVWKMLGAKNDILTTDVSISCASVDKTLEYIRNGIVKGFKAIKVKVGSDFERDVELVKHLEEFDKNVKFRFDANQGWTETQTKVFIEELNKHNLNIELIEQPVKYFDIKTMASITRFSNFPILADESVFSEADAIRLLEEKACNMLNIKLAKTGGVLEAKKIKMLANENNIPCMIGCMMESPLGIVAAASFALAENISMADLDVLDWIDKSYYSKFVTFDEPNIILSKSKGFGYTV